MLHNNAQIQMVASRVFLTLFFKFLSAGLLATASADGLFCGSSVSICPIMLAYVYRVHYNKVMVYI